MAAILHIITKADDSLAREVIAGQTQQADTRVEIVDLTEPDADYELLLEKIFAADSVEVW